MLAGVYEMIPVPKGLQKISIARISPLWMPVHRSKSFSARGLLDAAMLLSIVSALCIKQVMPKLSVWLTKRKQTHDDWESNTICKCRKPLGLMASEAW